MTAREKKKGERKGKGKGRIVRTRINKKKTELSRLATALFDPVGKNPYYLRGSGSEAPIPIKNLYELKDMLDWFGTEHADGVASWIEYLGDKATADRIRGTPEKFKEIINARHEELQEFFSGRKKGEG